MRKFGPVAANVYSDSIRDAEYVARVRRHSPSSLVPLVAEVAAQYWQRGSWLKSPYKKFTPWALADIARVSLISGNEHRQAATVDDLLQCAAAYVAINDPELSGHDEDSVTGFMLRITAEQLSYAQTPFNEVGRTAALFEHTKPTKSPKVIKPGWSEELFGCTLSQYVATGFFIQAAAAINAGRFAADWFNQPSFNAITAVMPIEFIRGTADLNFVKLADSFKLNRPKIPAGDYRRFTYNPLLGKPVVAGLTSDLLLPVPGLLSRKISPSGVYYAGAELWGNSFTDDVGDLFEQYIGRQLKTIPNAKVSPEVVYDNGGKRSVDWFIVCSDVVVLVEVKSVRPTEAVRLGKLADAGAELRRMLGRAYKQLEISEALVGAQHAGFEHIPADLPRIGLIVTMEPFAIANATPVKNLTGSSAVIPTTVCSCEDIEKLVALDGKEVGTWLLAFLTDPSQADNRITSGLLGEQFSRNQVLDEAWKSYDWGLPGNPAGIA